MQSIPVYVYLTFGATVLVTAALFYKASRYSKPFLVITLLWVMLQSILGIAGFYSHPLTATTRFPLLILPPLLCMFFLFASRKGRAFIDRLDLPMLTLLQSIRIPVEIVLFWLYTCHTLPQALTFEGRNFDLFSGISAPVVYYLGFVKKILPKGAILTWSFVCLLLLVNVVTTAMLALPGRYERFGFEQPNTAPGFFPFVLLPSFMVPVVLFSMLAIIRQLAKKS